MDELDIGDRRLDPVLHPPRFNVYFTQIANRDDLAARQSSICVAKIRQPRPSVGRLRKQFNRDLAVRFLPVHSASTSRYMTSTS
jgi:hypothetical protein